MTWEDDRKTSNRPLARAEMSETAAKQSRLRDTSDTGIGFPERSLSLSYTFLRLT